MAINPFTGKPRLDTPQAIFANERLKLERLSRVEARFGESQEVSALRKARLAQEEEVAIAVENKAFDDKRAAAAESTRIERLRKIRGGISRASNILTSTQGLAPISRARNLPTSQRSPATTSTSPTDPFLGTKVQDGFGLLSSVKRQPQTTLLG